MKYWLIKSDPDEFGWKDLKRHPDQQVQWDGVRSFFARKYLKEMKKNDLAFFYHSSINPQCITGIVRIIREAYIDPTQFDPENRYYDPKSDPEDPKWFMVDIEYLKDFKPPILQMELKSVSKLQKMILFQNTRLSVQPVTRGEWKTILDLRSHQ
jgi:predicted RNA-binding protein with PUA-like domain